jgi:hypothetical protein
MLAGNNSQLLVCRVTGEVNSNRPFGRSSGIGKRAVVAWQAISRDQTAEEIFVVVGNSGCRGPTPIFACCSVHAQAPRVEPFSRATKDKSSSASGRRCRYFALACRICRGIPGPRGHRRWGRFGRSDSLNNHFSGPRGSVQKRPTGVISKPANGSGPELLEVVRDRELSKQGKSGLFPQSSKKVAFRSPLPRFLEVAHGSGHGFSGAEGSVCNLVLQLRGPHLRM